MKSSAALMSSRSPRPSSNAPALRPTPRKLKRRTGQPIRASALAAWKRPSCASPPAVGGCARTAMAVVHPRRWH
jgi:hypothetical protein